MDMPYWSLMKALVIFCLFASSTHSSLISNQLPSPVSFFGILLKALLIVLVRSENFHEN